jgi:hypothetical protein
MAGSRSTKRRRGRRRFRHFLDRVFFGAVMTVIVIVLEHLVRRSQRDESPST